MKEKIINSKCDRIILLLLENKTKKTCSDKRKIRTLRKLYPDYEKYRDELTRELLQQGYLERTDLTPEKPVSDENGYPVAHDFSPPTTNTNGLFAIRNSLFPSEYAKERREKRTRIIDVVVKLLAVIGGLLGIINTVKLFLA
jgi:hypothetical protein